MASSAGSPLDPSQMLYARGFLLTREPHTPPLWYWRQQRVAEFCLSHDPRVDFAQGRSGDAWVALVGRVLDIDEQTSDIARIAAGAAEALRISETAFLEKSDGWSGRFVMLYGKGGERSLVADACGTRTVFFAAPPLPLVIGSHGSLVASHAEARPVTSIEVGWLYQYGHGYCLPGHYTPFEDVYFLTPNLRLDLRTRDVRRIFPRGPLSPMSAEEAGERILGPMQRQLRILSDHEQLAMSLSAGIDTRTTLAAARPFVDRMRFFTYYVQGDATFDSGLLAIDRDAAHEMAENLRLRHQFVEVDGQPCPPELAEVFDRNTFIPHGRHLAMAYARLLPPGSLHLRSNLSEIGRASLRRRAKGWSLPLTAERMAQTLDPKAPDNRGVVRAFEHFVEWADFKAFDTIDPYDLFYWEHLMGTWHASLLLETDVAHDTFTLFNNRRILQALLSVRLSDRIRGSAYRALIRRSWPVLEFWPFNALRSRSSHQRRSDFDELGEHLDEAVITGSSLESSAREVPIAVEWRGLQVRFWMTSSNPQPGDCATFTYIMPTTPGRGHTVSIDLRSPYENPKLAGRVLYQILLDRVPVLEEDVSASNETNHVRLTWFAEKVDAVLEVRVYARRQCEPWSWGHAGRIIIERITHRSCDHRGPCRVVTTSPFSTVLTPVFHTLFAAVSQQARDDPATRR
jgi:hypothetical protein